MLTNLNKFWTDFNQCGTNVDKFGRISDKKIDIFPLYSLHFLYSLYSLYSPIGVGGMGGATYYKGYLREFVLTHNKEHAHDIVLFKSVLTFAFLEIIGSLSKP